jgi:hypothetical protein
MDLIPRSIMGEGRHVAASLANVVAEALGIEGVA